MSMRLSGQNFFTIYNWFMRKGMSDKQYLAIFLRWYFKTLSQYAVANDIFLDAPWNYLYIVAINAIRCNPTWINLLWSTLSTSVKSTCRKIVVQTVSREKIKAILFTVLACTIINSLYGLMWRSIDKTKDGRYSLKSDVPVSSNLPYGVWNIKTYTQCNFS